MIKGSHFTKEQKERLRRALNKPEYKRKMQKILFKRGWKGKKHPNWKGGIVKLGSGYVIVKIPTHPFADKRGYVLQHRLVMEKYIKRFLLPTEIVHHINERRDDNRIENLQLLQNIGQHNSVHKSKRNSIK